MILRNLVSFVFQQRQPFCQILLDQFVHSFQVITGIVNNSLRLRFRVVRNTQHIFRFIRIIMFSKQIDQNKMIKGPTYQRLSLGCRIFIRISGLFYRLQRHIGSSYRLVVICPHVHRIILCCFRSVIPVIHLFIQCRTAMRATHLSLLRIITHHLAYMVIMSLGISRYQNFFHRIGRVQQRPVVGYNVQKRVTRHCQHHHQTAC